MERDIWFDGRETPLSHKDIWALVNNSGIKKVVLTLSQRQAGHFPLKTEFVTEIHTSEELSNIPSGELILSDDQGLLRLAKEKGFSTCVSFSIDSAEALDLAWKDASKYDCAVVEFNLPTNIPLELILARMQQRHTVILKRETSFAGLEVALGVLEQGCDGVLFASADVQELAKVNSYLSQQVLCHVKLQNLVVKEVRHVGVGARACVDTTGLMTTEEGMLVGSTSSGGIFVCSETHYLPYMNLRPFRVNAGAVHSYIWMPDDVVEYLTDLKTGSKVLCVNIKGEAREMVVGRIKIEVRPLLMIKGEAIGKEINVIVQDDWHIRLMGSDGKPYNATVIRPGSELLAYVCDPGRHVGIRVSETIIEK